MSPDVLRYHIAKEGEGEVVEGKGFRHIFKAKTDRIMVILTEMDPGAETEFYEHEGEECFTEIWSATLGV